MNSKRNVYNIADFIKYGFVKSPSNEQLSICEQVFQCANEFFLMKESNDRSFLMAPE